MSGADEIPLRGGRVTHGVVRIGDTARRPPTGNSAFVRRLLQHLTAKGFEGAPAALGTDEQGREVFTFIEGEVPADLGFHDDEVLCKAASLIRDFHDLSAELVAAPAAIAAGIEVICHNDLSPCNFVFRDGVPMALIDFDAAAPGSRANDLGYAAWLWLDLGSPEIAAPEQRRRLALFLKAYGTDDVPLVLAAVLTRQAILVEQGRRLGDDAMRQWAADCLEWTRRNERLLLEG
jgi:aminoglycoside phosphotransferase (APT) family kinase protein